MKAIFFCLLIFFICFFAKAQTYHSFMHDTAIWSEVHYSPLCCDPPSGDYINYGINFIMMNDTAMGSFIYKKIYWQQLWCSSNGNCFPCVGQTVAPPLLLGFVREDTSRKIFFWGHEFGLLPVHCTQESFESEKILYDFGLSIGDTVSWKPFNKIVTAIDSIQAPNGEFLRRIIFQLNENDYWVEGLGSSIGLFGSYTHPPFECDCELWCAQASDLLLPDSPPPCGGIVNAVSDLHSERKLQISPNPFSDFIFLNSPFQSSSILPVMNSQGEIISKRRLLPFEKISLTKNELPVDDFIFFRLISDDGASQSGIAVHIF